MASTRPLWICAAAFVQICGSLATNGSSVLATDQSMPWRRLCTTSVLVGTSRVVDSLSSIHWTEKHCASGSFLAIPEIARVISLLDPPRYTVLPLGDSVPDTETWLFIPSKPSRDKKNALVFAPIISGPTCATVSLNVT